jgi:intracellular sulfur oxidation DsrE/DsrF family protein
MIRTVSAAALGVALLLGAARPAVAQDAALPVPGVAPARDVPGHVEGPDKNLTFKLVFDVATEGKPGEVHPMLQAAARFINTLAKSGVPAAHRQIAVVFHQGGTDFILQNEEYKKRHEGKDNPSLKMIQDLKQAGVDFRVCGQAVLGRKIDPKTIAPEVQLDLWAMTTIANFLAKGYALIGG